MKTVSSAYHEKNHSRSAEPRYVFRLAFDNAETDLWYFVSHDDISLPVGATSYAGRILSCSSTSQELDLENNSSTIGRLTIKLQDRDKILSALFYSKLSAGEGLRGKIGRLYYSYYGLDWTTDMDGKEIVTQIIDGIDFENGAYTFYLSDIQRQARKQICIPKVTNLSVDISATGTPSSITVTDTTEFLMVAHGTSYSDAPSATVGYIKIDDEVFRYTGKTANTFTGITRARFGSVAAEHKAGTNVDTRQNKKVEEYIYLEMPVIKMILALYTGLSGLIPTHWHAGISSTWIEQTEWDGIGTDIYNTSDDTLGVQARISGISKIDAKQFVEQNLNKLGQCVQVVRGNGKLGLRRLGRIDASAPSLGVINEDDALSLSALTYDMSSVANVYQINWNYDDVVQKGYTRHNVILDTDSSDTHGHAPAKILDLRAVYGNSHTLDTLNYTLGFYRDLFAGPPLILDTDLARPHNIMEVGDVHTLQFRNCMDINTGKSLDRAYMATRVAIDWMRGKVSARWFGSSQRAAPLSLFSDSTVLPDSAYGSALGGTELEAYLAANHPGQYTSSSGAIVLTSGVIYLTGGTTLSAGRYYLATKALVINDGVTVIVSHNVYLWVRDGITCNGKVDGKYYPGYGGGGLAGAASGSPARGTSGYIGNCEGGGSIVHNGLLSDPTYFSSHAAYTTVASLTPSAAQAGSKVTADAATFGTNQQLPIFNLSWNGSDLVGLPTDLRPTSGGNGGPVYKYVGQFTVIEANGGAGGYGSASLVTVSRGFNFGPSGRIELSGQNGSTGSVYSVGTKKVFAVSGTGAGGAPGVWLHVSDGANVNIPTVVGHVYSAYGKSGLYPTAQHMNGFSDTYDAVAQTLRNTCSYVWANETQPVGNAALAQVIQLRPPHDPVADVPLSQIAAPTGLSISSGESELIRQADGTIVPRMRVSWIASASEHVIGYRFEWRKSTDANYTSFSGLITPDVTFVYLADGIKTGVQYDIRVKAVNLYGYESAYASSINYTCVGTSQPPPAVDSFLVRAQPDGTREFSWTYGAKPVDFAGFVVRYKLGSGATWDDMTDAHTEYLVASPWETNQLAAGSYTFAIAAYDRTGNISEKRYIDITLPDPRLAGVIDQFNVRSTNWSGTLTNCRVNETNDIEALDQNDWSDLTTWAAWTTWLQNPYGTITYEHTAYDIGAIATFTPLVTATGNGTQTITVSTSTDGSSYTGFATPALVTARYIKVKVQMVVASPTGSNYPFITDISVLLSAQPLSETIEDLDTSTLAACVSSPSCSTSGYRIAAGDFRLPITSNFAVIKNVSVTLQNVAAGYSWVLIDKDVNVGPRIKIYDASDTLADATIDAAINGL